MKRHKPYIAIALSLASGLLLTVAGCRSHREVSQGGATGSRCGYERLTATFDTEVAGVTVNGLLRAECDSVVWLSASKIIELGRARLTRDSVAGYLKVYNRFFSGTYDDLYRQTGYRTSFEEVQRTVAEAYKNQQKQVHLDINARQMKHSFTFNIKSIEATTEPLTYPFRIPNSARVL